MSTKGLTAALLACAAMWGVAACGSSGGGGGSGGGKAKEGVTAFVKPGYTKMQQTLGKGEGQLNIVNWAGYAEDGSSDPKVDWVTPFEQKTGCKVNSKVANTSDEMVALMRTGQYDGVSASGDATLRLIAGGDVAPVNTKLVPTYADVYAGLKNKPWNSVDGQMYGIPHGRGANLLMWRTDKVKGNLDSWAVVWDKASKYKGYVTAYDAPTYIADAALYLKATRPELKITNPFALDGKQFSAAVDLLKQQRQSVGRYWSDYAKEQQAFASGDTRVGTTWQVTANLLEADKVPIRTTLPKEGSTGWSDTWMISSKAQHPNCMYQWMDWIISPKPNAQVAEWFGEAPANPKACGQTAVKDHCRIFHADDESYFSKVTYWTTPTKQCGDARGAVCKDYSEWVQAWTEIKG